MFGICSYSISPAPDRFRSKSYGSACSNISNLIYARSIAFAVACLMVAPIGCGSGSVTAGSSSSEAIQISPSAVNFGSVGVGQAVQSSVAILNTSTAPVAISHLSLSEQAFSISSTNKLPINIPAGGTYTLSVGFAPASAAVYSGLITMMDASSKSIAQLPMSGSGLADGNLSVSTTNLNFGNVAVNSAQTQPVTLTSTGTTRITVNSVTASGSGFTLLGGSFPVTLNPTQALVLQVQFDPTSSGAASGQLTISSNSATTSMTVGLTGTGISSPRTGSPQLTVSSASLSFGDVTVNTGATQSLTLTSIGTSPVTVNSVVTTGAGFTIVAQSFPVTLNPSRSLTVQVQFDPTTTGAANGQIAIISNSLTSGTALVALGGTGVPTANRQLTLSAGNLNFGTVTVNTAMTQSLTLTSTGTSAVIVNTAAVTGAGFSILGGSFPVNLNPSQSVTLQVQFSPTTVGTASGQITVTSTSRSGSTSLVTLNGSGIAVAHEVDLSWNAPADSSDPVVGYNIYRSTNSGSFALINSALDTAVVYVDNAVVSGSTYSYFVKSVDGSGIESVESNQITVTIP
jgi:Abnormal spindle-like microcephaly-assoc'd, ASPM-SPD-2-Hydin